MARIINSPGVQITEKDLSLRTQLPVGTNITVPGFASQGPVSEPLLITSTSELEAIYGVPTTPAEKYFYYSCKEVLNSPGILTTLRLPYGEGNGSAFSSGYSGLFYPMLSAGTSTDSVSAWEIGTPTHASLTPAQYEKISQGNFEWTGSSTGSVTLGADIEIDAGFFILNDLQSVLNEIGEGYYVGFADNLAVQGDSPNFDSVLGVKSLTAVGGGYSTLATADDTSRVDFALSATKLDSDRGVNSLSETLEKVGFIGFETNEYQDHLSLGVFKIRRSTSDATLLTLATSEKYLGSFDYNRKKVSPSGGILENSFIETLVNEASPTIKMAVNPSVSKDFDWTAGASTVPTSRVVVTDGAKALYPLGVYTPDTRSNDITKIIGNVPAKLDKSLRTLETIEDSTVDIIIDCGLSTIYTVTNNLALTNFNDETYVGPISGTLVEDWRAVANEFINFAENSRRDCMTIIDPPRGIFITGKDQKVIDAEDSTFSEDIYKPLREVASYETNYAAIYANWVKVNDLYSNRRLWMPFSGYAAAVYARNDAAANTWAAPAGMNRGMFNVLDIAFNPNQKQRDRLYEISVNPVVFFSAEGFVVYGQKTLQTKPTAFDRVNVRRLFLTLERAVQRTMKYFVFEPNTDFTRSRIRNTITPVFEYAKNTEGVYDYLIVCDERNNTPDSIDNNELIVDIYLKPVRTAEFILVNFIATRTGQNFSELI